MKSIRFTVFAGLCALVVAGAWAVPASAQMAEVKEKPPLYSYIAFWAIPRARWAEMDKATAGEQKAMDKALASGVLVGYGDDSNLVHQPDGYTHDNWWQSMSMAGLLNTLDELSKASSGTSTILTSATKHEDGVVMSRHYNYRAGSYKGVYSFTGSYKLKADAPSDAVETVSKAWIVPLMEKLFADGTLVEYEIDVEAVHTSAPGMFWISYIAANAEGIDKARGALLEALKKNPLAGPAFGSMVEWPAHRDYLSRTNATYK